jgi:hypothetical protein
MEKMNVKNRWIARVGLGAAALVLVASLAILIFQGAQTDNVPLNSLQPAHVGSTPSSAHGQEFTGSHGDSVSSVGL